MLARGPDTPQAEVLRALLRTTPVPDEAVLIAAHRPNLVDAAGSGFADLAEREIVTFRPMAEPPGFRRVARIQTTDWPALLAAARG
ncbi:hypothetical protein ACFQX4_18095 [Roseomonas sp. GCM10028921]